MDRKEWYWPTEELTTGRIARNNKAMSDEKKTVTGIVFNLQAQRPYEAKSGKNAGKKMHPFEVEFDRGGVPDLVGIIAFTEDEIKDGKPPIENGKEYTFSAYPKEGYPDQLYLQKTGTQGGGFKGGGRTWTPDPERETREERNRKQRSITRLAVLNTACSLISSGAGPATAENAMAIATKLEDWVNG